MTKFFLFRNNLKNNIINQTSVIMIMAVLSIAILGVFYISNVSREMAVDYSSLIIDQTTKNLGQNFVTLQSLMNSVYNYEVIIDTLPYADTSSDYDQLVIGRRIGEVLRNILHFRRDIRSVSIYSLKNGYLYQYSKDTGYAFGIVGNDTNPLYEQLNDEHFSDRLISMKTGNNSYSVYQAIRGSDMRSPIAIIRIELDNSELRNLSDDINQIDRGTLIISDSVGEFVYEQIGVETIFTDDMLTLVSVIVSGGQGEIITLQSEKYLINTRYLEIVEWWLVYLIPLNTINRGQNLVISISIGVIILFLLLGGTVSMRLANKIAKHLRGLLMHLKKIEEGDFSPQPLNRPLIEEVGELAVGINSMCVKINELIESEYTSQILAKDAQLNALIAQLNPHFLYNVMENISGIGYLHGIPELGQITEYLSDLLRYSIDDEQMVVPIDLEITYIEKYIALQNIRFDNRIHFICEIPEHIRHYSILKFLLQPIVENSIIHGLWPKEESGSIQISADESGNSLLIIIEDDGIGIEPVAIDALNKQMRDSSITKNPGSHLGIYNVHKRIKLFYGTSYGIQFHRTADSGIQATLTIPIRR